jgi:hypothetical protein
MFWLYATLSSAGILEPVICSCVAAELIGYRLQQLLGTDHWLFLSAVSWFTRCSFSSCSNEINAR